MSSRKLHSKQIMVILNFYLCHWKSKKAPVTCQALMNKIFRNGNDSYVVVYFDDIYVFSDSLKGHLKNLRVISSRLRDQNLYFDVGKYKLMRKETEFLGFVVGTNGTKIENKKKIWSRTGQHQSYSLV